MNATYWLIAALVALALLALSAAVLFKQEQRAAPVHNKRSGWLDGLTGLINHQMFINRLDQVLQIAQTDRQHVSALLKVNLDGFKRVNDAGGHAAGDSLLKAVAQCLDTNIRDRDTVSRLGADEFMVLLVQVGNTRDQAAGNAMRVAHKLSRLLLKIPVNVDDTIYRVHASFGLALLHVGVEDTDTLMHQTDVAMQQAKADGGGRCVFYNAAIQHEVQERLQLERDLHRAIDSPQLSFMVQPQIDGQGLTVGAELLMRWQHPEHGAIAPDVFIPLAEESGFIHELTRWSVHVACNLLLELRNNGLQYPLSVNISPQCLINTDFFDFVQTKLTETGAEGHDLIFEVTEGVWIQDIDQARAAMLTFRSLGIQFAMDDFGSGYANLAYLKHLPLAELKIDKSLVQGIPDDGNNTAISNFIIMLGQQLGMRVVAEGVETRTQSLFLYSRGCNAQQGFLHARPMPISQWLGDISPAVSQTRAT